MVKLLLTKYHNIPSELMAVATSNRHLIAIVVNEGSKADKLFTKSVAQKVKRTVHGVMESTYLESMQTDAYFVYKK